MTAVHMPEAWGIEFTARRLADVARPARGRWVDEHVLFCVASPAPAELEHASRSLVSLLVQAAGITRCGPPVIDVAVRPESVARVLSSPLTRRIPVARLNAVHHLFKASPRGSVLLTAHCPVLWPQVASQVRLS